MQLYYEVLTTFVFVIFNENSLASLTRLLFSQSAKRPANEGITIVRATLKQEIKAAYPEPNAFSTLH